MAMTSPTHGRAPRRAEDAAGGSRAPPSRSSWARLFPAIDRWSVRASAGMGPPEDLPELMRVPEKA
jgi:hypothetical protein